MLRVRSRLTQFAARVGTHGSTAALRAELPNNPSSHLLAGMPPGAWGVAKSGVNAGSTFTNR
jgi:hypothetical protein